MFCALVNCSPARKEGDARRTIAALSLVLSVLDGGGGLSMWHHHQQCDTAAVGLLAVLLLGNVVG